MSPVYLYQLKTPMARKMPHVATNGRISATPVPNVIVFEFVMISE